MHDQDWTTEEHVLCALQELPEICFKTLPGVSMKGVDGAPDWTGCEIAVWDLSEKVWEFLQSRRKLRGKTPILDLVEELVSDPKFGKGRQNFVLLLGQYGKDVYGKVLGALLNDADVQGYAISALNRANIPGYAASVTEILAVEKRAWIKNAAKKYLAQFP